MDFKFPLTFYGNKSFIHIRLLHCTPTGLYLLIFEFKIIEKK